MRPGGRMFSALLATGLLAAACGSMTGTRATTGAAPKLPGAAVSVQSEFGGNETFCADGPLIGTIGYDTSAGGARLDVGVGGLPPSSTVEVNWLNNPIRGYVIGDFATNSAGHSVALSTRMFRPGESRGYQIQLSSPNAQGTVLGILRPCG